MMECQDNRPSIRDKIESPISIRKFERSCSTLIAYYKVVKSREYILTRIPQVGHEVTLGMHKRRKVINHE